MNRLCLPGIFLAALGLLSTTLIAAPTQQTAAAKQAEMDNSPLSLQVIAVSKVFDDMRRRHMVADAEPRAPKPDAHNIEFRDSVSIFLDVTLDFQSAVLSGGDSSKHAKTINAQTAVFLRYVKWKGSREKRPDTLALEKLSPPKRTDAMMQSLSRILVDLGRVLEDDRQLSTSIQHSAILASFEKEAYLLQWLSSHLR